MLIFRSVKNKFQDKIKVMGLTIYEKELLGTRCKRKYLGGIFKTISEECYKEYYFLGIRIYKKVDEFIRLHMAITHSENRIKGYLKSMVQSAFAVAEQHRKVFPQFKNKHFGEKAVITATGPSVLYYTPIKDAIHVGVNSVHTNKEIKLDYWLTIDIINVVNNFEELKSKNFVKLFGQAYQHFPYLYYTNKHHHANSKIDECKNSYKFYFEHGNYSTINYDPSTQLFPDLGGCIFSALYFTLYTGVKKIYIVGCDTSQNGYFNNDSQDKVLWSSNVVSKLINGWKTMKNYIEIFYPDVELISINPVGLRGIFKDVYTQSYLDANPDLKAKLGNNVEILEDCI